MRQSQENWSSTDYLIHAARQRGVDVVAVPGVDDNLVLLELGDHRECLYYARTDHHGAATMKAFENKLFTTALLRRGGFPTPAEIYTDNLDEAAAFMRQYGRVVVKPLGNTGGIGITTGVDTPELLATAFERARSSSNIADPQRRAIFQQHVTSNDCRILVVNQQHVFGIERVPAHVVGDGQRTIAALVAVWNARRPPTCIIKLNAAAHELLAQQQVVVDSVPTGGQHIQLAYVSNYHSGGSLRDVTDILGEKIVATARAVAQYFAVPLVGIDFLTHNPSTDVGVIIELNGTPAITIHHRPDEGQPRDVSSVIIDMLFPETAAKSL